MSDPTIDRLLALAAAAPNHLTRLHYLLEASLRPGMVAFTKNHVLVHGGPQVEELPDVYMGVFANLAAELIENYIINTGENAGARKALRKFMKERFAHHLDQAVRSKFETLSPPMERFDS